MAISLRICLLDQGGTLGDAFRKPFEQLHNVQIAGEFTSWDGLQNCLQLGNIEAVAVALDGQVQSNLMCVHRITEVLPDCGVIGVSSSSDAESIIAAMRAGCGQYVRWPIEASDLQAAVDRIRSSRMPTAAASKRVCVIGSSGGAGATTIACNLAMELAQLTGRRSGLIDLNVEFGDVACAFDCTPKYSISDVCRDGIEIDRTLLETALHELPCNVSLLARPERVEDSRDVSPDGVDHMLRVIAQLFPFVVIDLPRSFSLLSAAALSGADRVLIITQLSVPFLRNATRIYQSLLHMGAEEGRLEIVLNRCNANFERLTVEDVARHFGRPIFSVVPNDYRRVTASRDLGHPIMTDAPNSPARMAIQTMGRTLAADHLAQEKRQNGANPGLLSKLWKR